MWLITPLRPMNMENRLLVADEPFGFEKYMVEVHDVKRSTYQFRGICRICLKLISKTGKTTTWNRLDLETLGF